jgi:hypothetical protein
MRSGSSSRTRARLPTDSGRTDVLRQSWPGVPVHVAYSRASQLQADQSCSPKTGRASPRHAAIACSEVELGSGTETGFSRRHRASLHSACQPIGSRGIRGRLTIPRGTPRGDRRPKLSFATELLVQHLAASRSREDRVSLEWGIFAVVVVYLPWRIARRRGSDPPTCGTRTRGSTAGAPGRGVPEDREVESPLTADEA